MAQTPFPTDTEITNLQASTYNAGTNVATGYMYASGNPALPSPENPAPVSKIQGFLTAVKQLITWLKSDSPQLNQEAWIAPTLVNNYSNLTVGGLAQIGYYLDSLGNIHLQGLICKVGSVPVIEETIFTLPVGYRPNLTVTRMALTLTGAFSPNGILRVYSDGRVVIRAYSGTWTPGNGAGASWFSLDGLFFKP